MKSPSIYLACLTILLQLHTIVTDMEDDRCPLLKIDNGRVKLRSRGRVAKFRCHPTYQLFGNKSATCIRGTWDATPPLCIKNDCPRLPRNPKNGYWIDDYRGASQTLICDTGYMLNGTRTIYCHKKEWSDAIPVCLAVAKESQIECDFENEDLCGWTHDIHQNFNWSRLNYATPSSHIGTGPSFDHTKGQGFGGYYMYIESSSPRMENDTARLFSPIYKAKLSKDACFTFWYHMYGTTTGTLNVYIKQQSADIHNLTALFQKTGQQGNEWRMGFLQLPPVEQSFQIIIEAIRGRSYVSDIAIDDVKLSSGDECINITSETIRPTSQTMVTSSPSTAESDTLIPNTITSFSTKLPSPSPPSPPFSPDVSTRLVMMTSPAPPKLHTETTTEILLKIDDIGKSSDTSTLFTEALPSVNKVGHTSSSPTKSDTLAVSTLLTTITELSIDISDKSQVYSESFLSSSSFSMHQTHDLPTTPPSNKTDQNILAPQRPTASSTTMHKSEKKLNTQTISWFSPQASLSGRVFKISTKQEHRTTSLPSTIFKESPKQVKTLQLHGIAGIAVGAGVIALMAAVLIFILARRRMRLKKRNEMSEDSDVRYLTSDEALDFTLARPIDDDL